MTYIFGKTADKRVVMKFNERVIIFIFRFKLQITVKIVIINIAILTESVTWRSIITDFMEQ